MKKLFAIVMSLVLVAALPVTVFAADFVESPAIMTAPTIVSVVAENTNWDGEIILTSYADRAQLAAAVGETLEQSRNAIESADLSKIIPNSGYVADGLAVSDLFDITSTKDNYGSLTITLNDGEIRFVGLMHYTNGAWVKVDGATYADGKITFKVDSLSPFAVVVAKDNAQTGDSFNYALYIAVALVAACGAAALFVIGKRQSVDA